MSQVVELRYVDLLTCLVSDELLLPQMKRVDGMITDNRKRLLHKLHIEQVLKVSVIFVIWGFFGHYFHSKRQSYKQTLNLF